jgi:hypothetical protein
MSIDDDKLPSKLHNNEVLVASMEALESFSEDVQYLWCPRAIPILDQPPSSISFLRNHVARSVPCIIRNAITQGTAGLQESQNLSLTLDELVETLRDECQDDVVLTVNVTPDGHGDCVRTVKHGDVQKRMFVKPQERQMTIGEFRDELRSGRQASDGTHVVDKDENGRAIFSLGTNGECEMLPQTVPLSSDSDAVLYYSRQVRLNSTCICSLFTWSQLLMSEELYLTPLHFLENN